MRISEEELRKLALMAIEELGEKATPELVKKVVAGAAQKFAPADELKLPQAEKTTGRVILTSFGVSTPGIVATITTALANSNVDIRDMSQNIMEEFYTMIMIVDITDSKKDLNEIQQDMNKISQELNIKIYMQHEDIFQAMHRL